MTEATEIVIYKLRKGHSMADFILANASMNRWFKKQPGFQWRRLTEREDGAVVDVLLWRSIDDAKAAASKMMSETADSAVHAMIEQSSVTWHMDRVRQLTKRAGLGRHANA